jgi:hypothetical protein
VFLQPTRGRAGAAGLCPKTYSAEPTSEETQVRAEGHGFTSLMCVQGGVWYQQGARRATSPRRKRPRQLQSSWVLRSGNGGLHSVLPWPTVPRARRSQQPPSPSSLWHASRLSSSRASSLWLFPVQAGSDATRPGSPVQEAAA